MPITVPGCTRGPRSLTSRDGGATSGWHATATHMDTHIAMPRFGIISFPRFTSTFAHRNRQRGRPSPSHPHRAGTRCGSAPQGPRSGGRQDRGHSPAQDGHGTHEPRANTSRGQTGAVLGPRASRSGFPGQVSSGDFEQLVQPERREPALQGRDVQRVAADPKHHGDVAQMPVRLGGCDPKAQEIPLNPITAGEFGVSKASESRSCRPEAVPKVGTFVHGFHITPHSRRSGRDEVHEHIDGPPSRARSGWFRGLG